MGHLQVLQYKPKQNIGLTPHLVHGAVQLSVIAAYQGGQEQADEEVVADKCLCSQHEAHKAILVCTERNFQVEQQE